MVGAQAVQRAGGAAAAAAGAAGAAAGGRGGAPLLGRRAPRAPRAHEQAVRGDAGGLSAVSLPRTHCIYVREDPAHLRFR